MDCAEFEEIVHDLDRPGTRGLELRERALTHAEGCSRCARLVTESEALDFGLHTLALHDADRKASAGVEDKLLREFRRRKVQVAPRMVRWQMAAIGVAAIALLALGITLRYETKTNLPGTTSGTTAAVVNQTFNVPSTSTTSPDVENEPATAASASQSDDSEYATAFVPLPYADDASALDGGAVVRVMLSRSALNSLGLPAADMDGAERIPADLVVSDDGTPEAIRLVSQVNYE